jgi:PTH1 family peptidyl-tRNA hydrolase
MEERCRIIVGLGNPGKEYANNRHNVGFMIADQLAARHNLKFSRMMNKAIVALGEIAGCKVILVKPQTFMNLSGESVGPIVKFYKADLSHLLVIYDELDLPLGQLRMRPKGGAGGHNGMKSIIAQLGSDAFPRLRVGIGRPPGQRDPKDYVLEDFTSSELITLAPAFARAVEGIQRWLTEGIDSAMNFINQPANTSGT